MKIEVIRETIPKYIIEEIKEISGYLWERGWAERNAGNFSINLELNLSGLQDLTGLISGYPSESCSKLDNLSGLAHKSILISKTGTRMRDMRNDPFSNLILMIISNDALSCQMINLGEGIHGSPTTELSTHLAIQNMMCENKFQEKVVLHCHLTELIAMTQIWEFTNEKTLNRMLWNMHPETLTFIPDGIGLVPLTIPGSDEIARPTTEKFTHHKIVCWEKHGALSIGKSLNEAFDLMDIASKSAEIYFKVKSSGHEPEGFNDNMLEKIRKLLIS